MILFHSAQLRVLRFTHNLQVLRNATISYFGPLFLDNLRKSQVFYRVSDKG